MRAALKVYERLGATVKEVSLPHSPYAVAAYYLVATAEASSNLARYDGVHYGHRATASTRIAEQYGRLIAMYCRTRGEGFGHEVKRRIMLGTYALSSGYKDAYYLKALQVRRLIQDDFDRAFAECDVVVGPTSPTAAFKIGEKADDPLAMYLSDIYTISANLAGICRRQHPVRLHQGRVCRSACKSWRRRSRRRSCCAWRGCTSARPTGTRGGRRCKMEASFRRECR